MALAPDRPSLHPWFRGQSLDHRRFNDLQGAVITDITAGPGLLMARKGNSVVLRAIDKSRPAAPPIVRMKVTTPDAGPDVVLAVRYDGTTAETEETPVRVFWQREADEEIYAFRPAGGTDAAYGGAPVEWAELYRLGNPQYQGMHVVAVTQSQVGWDFHRAVTMPDEA